MSDLVMGSVVSVLTSVALWALLPRGVVLTRTVVTHDWSGERVADAWEIQNNSALPIKIISVKVSGVSTHNSDRDEVEKVELTPRNEDELQVSLSFDDVQLETHRHGEDLPWEGLVIPPGDTLRVKIFNNDLRIKYRRAGWFGLFERRQLVIHGYI